MLNSKENLELKSNVWVTQRTLNASKNMADNNEFITDLVIKKNIEQLYTLFVKSWIVS